MALLAKQGWRLLQFPQSLLARALRNKYHPSCGFMEIFLNLMASYAWKFIWEARGLQMRGVRWRVGNEESIKVCGDLWLPALYFFRVTSPNPFLDYSLKVCNLIDEMGIRRKKPVIRFFIFTGKFFYQMQVSRHSYLGVNMRE
ncbi:hypothetical protein M9H77_33858 [Catharanthus roseus]|uniref:Uncharacterized protein n=1 Tax=Catharanthus roseus TaxID=4058 RepID=A0ACB9ZJX1_CATRO|nr:hypothetical protein M9H77_33858 [Catharanthus roseus]